MTFWLVILFVLLVAWVRKHAAETDQELARLRREIGELRSQLRNLYDERPATPRAAPPTAPPVAAPLLPPPIPEPVAGGGASVSSIELPPHQAVSDEETGVVERAIGERWLLYAGVIVLLLAVVFFLRYAFERNWLSPGVRVGAGIVTGVLLVGAGRRLSSAGLRNYGLSLAGAGVVIDYLSIYAALNFYGLLPAPAAFMLLVAVSGAAAWLAAVEVSASLAVIAVAGGFATPFLVGGHQDAQVILFTYDALLIAATTFLAFRREWWYLNVLALALTVVTIGVWASTYYTPAKALRTELFLTLYCTMFLIILRASLRWTHPEARRSSAALIAAPVLYHLASVGILYTHPQAFLTYLILASTVALLIAERADLPVLRGAAWLAVTVPLAEWLDVSRAQIAGSLVTVVALYAVYLAAELQTLHTRRWHPTIDTLVNDANGLAVYAEVYIVQYTREPDHLAIIAAVLALWNVAVASFVWRWDRERALHWLGVAATLLAIAVAIAFEGAWVVVMWAVEGAALLAIAMKPDETKPGFIQPMGTTKPGFFTAARAGGWALLLIAAIRWSGFDVQQANAAAMVVLNARALSGLLLVALLYGVAIFSGPAADRDERRRIERAVAYIGATALAVAVVSREIDVYWKLRADAGEFTDIIRQAMLSGAWALSAAVAITIGMRRHYRPIRYFAIALFGITLAKVLVVDMDTLAGIDRIVAFLVLGVVLLFASFLYQRGRAQNS